MSDTVWTIALAVCLGVVFVLGCVLDARRQRDDEREKRDDELPLSHVRMLGTRPTKGADHDE